MPDDKSWQQRRFMALRTVLRAVSLSVTARLVYFDLDDRTGYKESCWPKQETIAKCLGISQRTVNEGIRDLAARGFIRVDRKSKGIEYFMGWNDTQKFQSDTQPLRITRPASLYEQQNEPRKEQRCSLCGGSGIAGSTGADLGFCGCAAGDEERRRSA